MVQRMPGSEHPLIPAHGPDAGPDLVRQGLKTETPIRCRKRTRYAVVGAFRPLLAEKALNGFLETTVQQIFVPLKGDQPTQRKSLLPRQMEAMNCIEEEERSHLFIKTPA
jgi:hypothetical protein